MSRPSTISTRKDLVGTYIVETFPADKPRAIVVGVSGFGMNRYDGHNLFKDIASSLVDYTVVLVDLNHIEPVGLTANPLSIQVGRLNSLLEELKSQPLPIRLVAHSMGCTVIAKAGVADTPTIFLAPAVSNIGHKIRDMLVSRPKTKVLPDGTMKAERSNGSITTIAPQFWDEVKDLDLVDLYSEAVRRLPVTLVVAEQDQLLKKETATILHIKFNDQYIIAGADHDLTGEARQKTIDIISNKLGEYDAKTLPKTDR